MVVSPRALGTIRAEVAGMIRDGWQPGKADGVTRDQLVAAVRAAVPRAESLAS
jgi:hypothetical protein